MRASTPFPAFSFTNVETLSHHEPPLEDIRGDRQQRREGELGGGEVAHQVLVVGTEGRDPVMAGAGELTEERARRDDTLRPASARRGTR